MSGAYRICVRCIMDTTDTDIQFDEQGVCHHCRRYDAGVAANLFQDETGRVELQRLVEEIKARGRGKPYDCIIGVSGGVDSTYVAYLVKQLGLRPLAVHMDNGWDSELAVHNVEKVLKHLDIDLYTHVLDWEEFRELQVSFLRASVPDAEIPTDHAIEAVLYRMAASRGIGYVISGVNFVTEGVLPLGWSYGGKDWRYIKSVHRRFGRTKLRKYPHYSLLDLMNYTLVRRIQSVRILNYVPYRKTDVMRILTEELGWEYYVGKHYESIYTRFFQGYILPRKFNIDKRRAHLSSLICSGQMTREEALAELAVNSYTEAMQEDDRIYVVKKLGLTEEEFNRIMALPQKSFLDYPTHYAALNRIRRLVQRARRFGFSPIRPAPIRS